MNKKIVVEGKPFDANLVPISHTVPVVVVEHEHHGVVALRMRKDNAVLIDRHVQWSIVREAIGIVRRRRQACPACRRRPCRE